MIFLQDPVPVPRLVVEQILHNTSRLCYETESFTKNTFLWKITKSTFLNSFVVNEFFSSLVTRMVYQRLQNQIFGN